MITGREIKALIGERFQLMNRGQEPVEFTIPDPGKGWPRSGLEAYGLPAVCHHPTKGDVPAFLKVFRYPLPVRDERTRHLVRFGLARRHAWLFSGIPFGLVSGVQIGSLVVHGHVTRFVPGPPGGTSEDVGRLRSQGRFQPDIDERARLAGHICTAIEGLERLGLVHGDISPANLIIGCQPDGRRAAILCDFDGFHKTGVPPLPTTHENKPIRGVGTTGFQAPHVYRQLVGGVSDVFVDTDRFALAAMCCELVAWHTGVDDADRDTLLDDTMIVKGSIGALSDTVTARWPDGFALLERAIQSRGPDDLPAPSEWLTLLYNLCPEGVENPRSFVFLNRPKVVVARRNGNYEIPIQTVRLLSEVGSFAPVAPGLNDVAFRWKDGRLCLTFLWPASVYVRRNGRGIRQHEAEVPVRPGDQVISGGFSFRVTDES